MMDLQLCRSVDEVRATPGADVAVFMTEEFVPDLDRLIGRLDGCGVHGAVVPYLIQDKRIIDRGLMVMELPRDGFAFTCSMSADVADIAARLGDAEGARSLLLFVDGLSPHMDPFISALDACAGDLDILGTGVGYKDLGQRPVVFDRDGIRQDRALIVCSGLKLQVAAKHGWRTIHGPLVVTRARDNILHELNGRPAFDVYRDVLASLEGVEIAPESFFDVAKSHPFGVSAFRGGEVIIRDPIAANPDGSLTIVSSVKEMDTLYIMKGDRAELIDSSGRLSRETFAHAAGSQAILFDCISRVLFLEDDFGREIEAVFENSSRPDLSVFGITSIGEITNIGHGETKILNKTTLLGVVEHD